MNSAEPAAPGARSYSEWRIVIAPVHRRPAAARARVARGGEKGRSLCQVKPGASESKKILIIGGGIAGLCAGVYARKCGYQAEVLEMNTLPGGLAMSWRRGEYTFETCLHWLVGSKPGAHLRDYWEELLTSPRCALSIPRR